MYSKSSSFLFEDNAIIFIDTHLHTVDEKQVGTIVIASQGDVENLIPLVKSIIKAQDSDCGNLEIVERCSEWNSGIKLSLAKLKTYFAINQEEKTFLENSFEFNL